MTAAPVVATGTAAMTCHYDKIVYTDSSSCESGTVTNGQKVIIGACLTNADLESSDPYWKVTKCGPKDGFHFTVHSSSDTTCTNTATVTFSPSATGECAGYNLATPTKWLEVPYAVCAGSSCSAQFSSDSSASSLDVAATTTTTTTTTATTTTTCPTTTTTDTTDGAASVLVGAGAMAMSLAYL